MVLLILFAGIIYLDVNKKKDEFIQSFKSDSYGILIGQNQTLQSVKLCKFSFKSRKALKNFYDK